jgi:dipeptidyl-peptidase-4
MLESAPDAKEQVRARYDVVSGQRTVLDASPQEKSSRSGSLSPDGTRIVISEQGNLYVRDRDSDRKIPLTKSAPDGPVSHSQAVWSPDGKRIAFVQSDDSDVKLRPVLVPDDPSYPKVSEVRFARVGGTIPTLRVGVVDAQGKETRWLPIPMPAEGFYLGEIGWAENPLNALFRKPDVYQVGIAVVPKPQPQYYNAGYQEIYMRTPQDNPEGYRTCAWKRDGSCCRTG